MTTIIVTYLTLVSLISLSAATTVRQYATVRNGLTHDHCTKNSECQEPRLCLYLDPKLDDRPRICTLKKGCVCIPSQYIPCTEATTCPQGEICASKKESNFTHCASQTVVDQNQDDAYVDQKKTDTDACIDASALHAFHAAELIFPQHRWAVVLCDAYGSCATAGHMVMWEGHGMMMRSYCRKVACVEKRMYVNSMRYKKGLRVGSRTDGLLYTAFAARFETSVEESVLRGAVRVGL